MLKMLKKYLNINKTLSHIYLKSNINYVLYKYFCLFIRL